MKTLHLISFGFAPVRQLVRKLFGAQHFELSIQFLVICCKPVRAFFFSLSFLPIVGDLISVVPATDDASIYGAVLIFVTTDSRMIELSTNNTVSVTLVQIPNYNESSLVRVDYPHPR